MYFSNFAASALFPDSCSNLATLYLASNQADECDAVREAIERHRFNASPAGRTLASES